MAIWVNADEIIERLKWDFDEEYAKSIVDDATSFRADMVEVVRCKDCIHWEKGNSKGGNSIEDLQWIGGCKWAKCCRREMDFCSMGERKYND